MVKNGGGFTYLKQKFPQISEVKIKEGILFYNTRGHCPLLALLVNSRLQGLRHLQPMLAKSYLFLTNIEQILIRFVYMRDQEKRNVSCKHLFG